MIPSFVTGLVTGLTLIVAIGAQNAFVIRQGLRREHIGIVIAICALSDALLILGGTAGVGLLAGPDSVVLLVMRWLGVAYLTWMGVRSLLAARHSGGLDASEAPRAGAVALTALALTWLNPHVYLDTVLMLGSIANQQGHELRWLFAAGAATGSVLWFTSIGLGARAVAPWLARPRTWQVIDVLVGLTMLLVALHLALG